MPLTYNDTLEDQPLFDRVEEFSGGVDEFTRATLLPPNVSQQFLNMIQDDKGRSKTRPGADGLGGATLSAAQRVHDLVYFDTPSTERVYASVNASLRSWDGSAWTTIGAYPFGANSIIEMEQGNNLLYCSDGVGEWRSYSGAAWSGALGATAADPPVGATMLAWWTQRMFAAGVASASDTVYASTIALGAGTGGWVGAANSVRVGRGEGQAITALCGFKGNWLFVGKETSCYIINADPQAASMAAWSIYRIGNKVGVTAKRCVLAMVDRILFLSSDGIRAVIPTEANDLPFEVGPPISQPMQPWIDRINWAAASKSVAWRHRQYAFFALPIDAATEPSHVLVLNLRTNAWMGVFTGWAPTCAETSNFGAVGERMLFGDSAGFVNEWKDYASESLATTFTDNGVAIPSLGRSRAFNFAEPVNWKDATWGEMRFVTSTSTATIRLYLDGIVAKSWTQPLYDVQNQLPLSLPFNLAVLTPKTVPLRMDDLREFNEAFLEVESLSGRTVIANLTMSAFMNTHSDE